MEFLTDFSIEIKCIEGKENKVVDALYRRVHEVPDTTINTWISNLTLRILEVENSYYQYMEIKTSLQWGEM